MEVLERVAFCHCKTLRNLPIRLNRIPSDNAFRTIDHLEKLETDLGKPVFSSNPATFADCLNLLGAAEAQPGFGSLFDRMLGQSS